MFDQPPPYHLEAQIFQSQKINLFAATEICLKNSYRLDQETISTIMCKMNPLLVDIEKNYILQNFIKKSNELNIQFSNTKVITALPIDDAVMQAHLWHEILFESPNIRILWTASKPGDEEPFHTHYWRSIMIIIHEGRYEILNADGSIQNDLWPIGVYELAAETTSAAYNNIGTTEFKALRFEIKE